MDTALTDLFWVINRGYYMPARGYEFYLLVFNSIYIYRVEHSKIKFVSTNRHTSNIVYYTDTDETPGKRFLGLILYSLNPV